MSRGCQNVAENFRCWTKNWWPTEKRYEIFSTTTLIWRRFLQQLGKTREPPVFVQFFFSSASLCHCCIYQLVFFAVINLFLFLESFKRLQGYPYRASSTEIPSGICTCPDAETLTFWHFRAVDGWRDSVNICNFPNFCIWLNLYKDVKMFFLDFLLLSSSLSFVPQFQVESLLRPFTTFFPTQNWNCQGAEGCWAVGGENSISHPSPQLQPDKDELIRQDW